MDTVNVRIERAVRAGDINPNLHQRVLGLEEKLTEYFYQWKRYYVRPQVEAYRSPPLHIVDRLSIDPKYVCGEALSFDGSAFYVTMYDDWAAAYEKMNGKARIAISCLGKRMGSETHALRIVKLTLVRANNCNLSDTVLTVNGTLLSDMTDSPEGVVI